MSVDDASPGRAGTKALPDGGSEDEAEAATTWRAYRATTFDSEETVNPEGGAGRSTSSQKGAKPSPAEVRK